MNYLFANNARKGQVYTEDDNLSSQKLCERLGMRKEGLFSWIYFIYKQSGMETPYENTNQYAILKKNGITGSVLLKSILLSREG